MFRAIAMLAVVLGASTANGAPVANKTIKEMREAVTLESQATKSVGALDGLLRVACWQVEKVDPAAAFEICSSWIETYRPMMLGLIAAEGLGDHEPLSAWLAVITMMIHEKVGDFVFYTFHLDDLDVFNFGLPVMFHPYQNELWCDETPDTVSCRDEYRAHAQPVISCTAYWLAYVGCSVGTMGTGMFMVCSPVGMVAEYVVDKTIAPKISDRIWDKQNG